MDRRDGLWSKENGVPVSQGYKKQGEITLTVSAPPEYNEAADHLMLYSSSGVICLLSSSWEVYDGTAVPAA